MMKALLAAAALAFLATPALAAEKTYQVTGPVLELTDSKIVVQKNKDKWELARNAATKLPAEVKVGSKVTIEYTMTAVNVIAKDAPKADAAKKDAEPKKK